MVEEISFVFMLGCSAAPNGSQSAPVLRETSTCQSVACYCKITDAFGTVVNYNFVLTEAPLKIKLCVTVVGAGSV